VGGWRCIVVDKLSQVELQSGGMAHRAAIESGRLALKRLNSTPTFSAAKIHNKDSEAIAALTSAPG
jgi:hypothetical protein